MKAYNKIKNDYIEKQLAIQKMKNKILEKELQIERLKKRVEKKYPYWTDELIAPVMKILEEKMPHVQFEDKRYIPMGLSSRVSVFPKYNEKTLMICFVPGDLSKGEIHIETGEKNEYYPPNSIGGMNGFGKVSVPLESIEQIVDMLQKQIDEG